MSKQIISSGNTIFCAISKCKSQQIMLIKQSGKQLTDNTILDLAMNSLKVTDIMKCLIKGPITWTSCPSRLSKLTR